MIDSAMTETYYALVGCECCEESHEAQVDFMYSTQETNIARPDLHDDTTAWRPEEFSEYLYKVIRKKFGREVDKDELTSFLVRDKNCNLKLVDRFLEWLEKKTKRKENEYFLP